MIIAPHDRNELLRLARGSIESGLNTGQLAPAPVRASAALNTPRATFVTLRIDGDLRGCCGSIEPRFMLAEDVWRNAWASAFADPRFPRLSAAEYEDSDVQISVLTPLEPMLVASEAGLIETLLPGVDGLVLKLGNERATFLPAVWEMLRDPVDFVRHLKVKAGWPASFWSPEIQMWRYRTESFGLAPAVDERGCG